MRKIRYLTVPPELEDEMDRLLGGELRATRQADRRNKAVAWIAVGAAMVAALVAWAWFIIR